MQSTKIITFQDLNAWKLSHQLALEVYKFTSNFPPQEKYGLIDQMRRCSVSISSNIAEGFARNSNKEKIQFYYTSLGSTVELQNQLIISKDLHFFSEEDFKKLFDITISVHKLINGLIKNRKALA